MRGWGCWGPQEAVGAGAGAASQERARRPHSGPSRVCRSAPHRYPEARRPTPPTAGTAGKKRGPHSKRRRVDHMGDHTGHEPPPGRLGQQGRLALRVAPGRGACLRLRACVCPLAPSMLCVSVCVCVCTRVHSPLAGSPDWPRHLRTLTVCTACRRRRPAREQALLLAVKATQHGAVCARSLHAHVRVS